MERLTRDEYLMEIAHTVARRGTCSRAQVGVVFAREGRILATGYNGAPPGIPHCVHESYKWPEPLGADPWHEHRRIFVLPYPDWLEPFVQQRLVQVGQEYYWDGVTVSTSPGCTVVSHAERNGIAFAAREGIRVGDTEVYCTHAPCLDCARSLLTAGIRSLTYQTPYRLTAGVELLQQANIPVARQWPDGTIMDSRFTPRAYHVDPGSGV